MQTCYRPRERSPFEKRIRQGENAVLAAIVLMTAALGAVFIARDFVDLLRSSAVSVPVTGPSQAAVPGWVELLIMVAALITGLSWVFFARYELQNLRDWIDARDYLPPSAMVVLGFSVPIVALVCLIIAFANKILIVAAVYFAYTLIDALIAILGTRQVRSITRGALRRIGECEEKSSDGTYLKELRLYRQGVEILSTYHTEPMRLIATSVMASAAGTIFIYTSLAPAPHTPILTGIAVVVLNLAGAVESAIRFGTRESKLNRVAIELGPLVEDDLNTERAEDP